MDARVPATLSTVIVDACSTPWPRERKHATDVADAHDVVPHSLRPSLDVGVVSRLAPKFKPDTVKLHPAVMPAFKLSTKLTTGAMVAQNNHVWHGIVLGYNKNLFVLSTGPILASIL